MIETLRAQDHPRGGSGGPLLSVKYLTNANANDPSVPSSPHANGTFRALEADQGLAPPANHWDWCPTDPSCKRRDGHGSSHWPLSALAEMGAHDALLQFSLEQRLPADTDS